MQSTKTKVTEEDIRNGERLSPTSCPIALAIKRKIPNTHVEVDEFGVIVGEHFMETTKEMEEFVKRFDAGNTVEPFIFELEL